MSRVLLVVCLVVATAAAQSPSFDPPRLAPLRCAPGQEPLIDGRLDDAVWSLAPALGDLTQVLPSEGAAPSQPTVLRLCYDSDYLYIGLHCIDVPRLVRANLMARDANLDPDDRVEVWVDTFGDGRFAYWFQIGAGGSKGDALLSDGGQRFNKSWDGIFYARSRIVADGWMAEMALPFKTMAFAADAPFWRFNTRRLRKESREEMRWASPRTVYSFFDLPRGGLLVGMHGMEQGLGVDVSPYAKVAAQRRRLERAHFVETGDFGGDLRYRLTPSLGLLLTYRTDFAETEVDARQVNLSRFPLFYPEKRDFFLEDADLFEFGAPDRSGAMLPFFSRRIGRDDAGEPVTILAGAKLAGRVDGWSLGGLTTLIDAHAGLDEKALSTVRVSKSVHESFQVGGIFTHGRPNADGDASTVGLDFKFDDDGLFGEGSTFDLWGYYVRTTADGEGGEGDAYGLQANYKTRSLSWTSSAHTVSEGFRPELGFVQRTDYRQYRTAPVYTHWVDGESVRNLSFRVAPTYTTDAAGSVDSWAVPVRWLGLQLQSGDSLQFETHRIHERLQADFSLRPALTVGAGEYTMTRHFATLSFSDARELSGSLGVEHGDFYDGTLTQVTLAPQLIASPYWQLSGNLRYIRVELPGGGFRTRVYEGRFDVTPSPELAWRNLVQYDTDSEALAWQSRLRYTFAPGRELFVLGTFGWERGLDVDAPSLAPNTQEFTIKLVYLLRF